MTSFATELQRIIDTLRSETLCAVIIDSTGERPLVELMFGQSLSFPNVHHSVLDALVTRGLLPERISGTLVERGIVTAPNRIDGGH